MLCCLDLMKVDCKSKARKITTVIQRGKQLFANSCYSRKKVSKREVRLITLQHYCPHNPHLLVATIYLSSISIQSVQCKAYYLVCIVNKQ